MLDNLSFEFASPGLYGVVGRVGAGKSSLLYAIMGELPPVSGSVVATGSISYSSQEAWIRGGQTVQENILFGQPMDRPRYDAVVAACQLLPDLASLPLGDQTYIGERGVTLR